MVNLSQFPVQFSQSPAFELQDHFNTAVERVEIKQLLGQSRGERREGTGICAQNWPEMNPHLAWPSEIHCLIFSQMLLLI